MKMVIKYVILTAVFLCAPVLHADALTESYVKDSKKFIAASPVITKPLKGADVVKAWQQVKGINTMIYLWHTNRSVFMRRGNGELRSWFIYKRINAHQKYLPVHHNDPQINTLIAMLKLHARFASDRMAGRATSGQYAAVAAYVKTHGKHLATQINKRYGRPALKKPKSTW